MTAIQGRLSAAKLLVASGADPWARDGDGDTPLDCANREGMGDGCCGGDGPGREFSTLVAFLEQLRRMTPDEARRTALRSWELVVAKRLQDLIETDDRYALQQAISCYHRHLEAKDYDGSTALHTAAELGKLEAARLLLDARADIGVRNPYGDTALHTATQFGHWEVTSLLLAHGADPTIRNAAGAAPAEMALRQRQQLAREGAEKISADDAACGEKTLVKTLAPCEEGNSSDKTVVIQAAGYAHNSIFQPIAKYGAPSKGLMWRVTDTASGVRVFEKL